MLPFQNNSDTVVVVRKKAYVDVRKYDALHGYADAQNENYSEVAYQQAFEDTINFFRTL